MSQPNHARDMSTLVGTSKTLERAISGLLMNSRRLTQLLAEDSSSPGIEQLVSALKKLTKEDQQVVDEILSHKVKPKRKPR
jgi:hypothetical protein